MTRIARLPGHPPIEVTLRRSAQARRFSLRVSRLDGRVTLTLPAWAPEAEALAFAAGKADWVRQALAGMGLTPAAPEAPVLGFGAAVPFEGRLLTLTPGRVRSPVVEGHALILPPDPDRAGLRAEIFLKHAARDRLIAASDRHAARLGLRYARITLRDTRSRWGSCTVDGGLMYSWRLVMAPPEVLDYVAAHEVAHLAEMNHSPAFWAVVARLMPGYQPHRQWLRAEGAALHRIRFRAEGG